MASNGQAPSEIISVPKGGGALHGIGEKFSPDLFTGSGNFSVPIDLPPARNGFQPQLSFVYSTGNGNGAFGLGWSLSVPSVSRKTSKGIPRYNGSDIFVLSGSEDLVPTDRTGASQYYQPRTEGLFAKCRHVSQGTIDYWEVATKDGLVSTYGEATTTATNESTIYDPAEPTHIFAWKLVETRDPFGNRIVYEYRRDKSQLGPRSWNQNYLKHIRYADFDDAGVNKFLVSVEFYYDDEALPHEVNPPVKHRADEFSEYRSSFEIRTRSRCNLILIRTHPVGADPIAVRAYRFVYLDERVSLPDHDGLLPRNSVSLLSRIEVIGYDDSGAASSELPPLDFAYTEFTPSNRSFKPVPAGQEPVPSLADPDIELVDLHGGGLPDLVQVAGPVRYWRNLGDGVFGPGLIMKEAPMNARLSDRGVQLLDMNGDGRADLLVRDGEVAATFTLEFGPKWKRRPIADRIAPSFDFKDPEVRLLDLDGDGVTDALRAGRQFECFFQDQQKGWRQVRTVARRRFSDFPDVSFSDPRVRVADMSGDGLQDIVFLHSGNIVYWPNLGYGNWGKAITMDHAPRLPWEYDPRCLLLGDIDGDGLADLIYVDHDRVRVWFNQGGNGWSPEPVEISGTPPVADGDVLRVIDLHGSGVAGLLWSAGGHHLARQPMRYLDLAGGIKPYPLDQMSNNLGATTRVRYVSSTKFFLDDNKCRTTRWRTPLPFPVQVVARVEVIDDLSRGKLTTEYRYHNGYWDGAEREFRGFGMVEQYDSEGFSEYGDTGLHGSGAGFQQVPTEYFSAPTLTRTWFHQGPVGDEYGDWEEQDYSDAYWQGDPPMLGHQGSVDSFLGRYCTAAYPHARRDMRDALRTLRGSMLRSELYARDGSSWQDRPFTVTESAYGLREESPPAAAEPERRRIFYPHMIAQRTTQWERGNDPMTRFTFIQDYDAFGQPCRQVSIACPRGWKSMADQPAKPYLATLSVTTYAQPAAAGPYIHDRIARTRGYEILSSANKTVTDLQATTAPSGTLRLISESLNFYDGNPAAAGHGAFAGLAFGVIGQYGAPVRTETLVLTEDILLAAYGSNAPPYLDFQTPFITNADYPQAFVDALPALAGYVFKPGGAGSEYSRGYFAVAASKRYDFHTSTGTGRGLLLAQKDPLGNETQIEYDTPYKLLPISVTDPQAMTIAAEYDYRVLKPKRVTDPNQNVTDIAFTAAGLVEKVWVKGKLANTEGDRRQPGTVLEYGLRAFYDSILIDPSNPDPVYVRSVQRVFHDTDPDDTGETIETREYSDGFGRLLQTRAQGEALRFGDAHFGGGDDVLTADQSSGAPSLVAGTENTSSTAPNVTVSGWQRYDNKGRVVEKFEPFFDAGWNYDPPAAAQYGKKATMFYDPRGQAIRTVNPDGSEQRVIYCVPKDLADPPLSPLDTAKFDPTPWEACTYDPNDNAGRTHAATSGDYRHHWNTPASIETDAMGRTVRAVVRHRNAPANAAAALPAIEEHVTRSTYDIQGNLMEIRDALGRLAFQYFFDLARRPLRTESIDAGRRLAVVNAAGNPVETRDAKGAITLHAYDALHRPTHLWARDATGETITLREKLVYGDSTGAPGALAVRQANNRLGKPYSHNDEAGLVTTPAYDFKGNLLASSRQVLSDDFLLSAINDPARRNWALQVPRVDWDALLPPELEATIYQTRSGYDALNRIKWSEYPECANGERYRLQPEYNRAGALEKVNIVGPLDASDQGVSQSYVRQIAYSAKGQRVLIAYGNSVMTRYAYENYTFRLARLRTEPYTTSGNGSFTSAPGILQDLAYSYDLTGNILTILDRTPGSGVTNNLEAESVADAALRQRLRDGDALLRRFAYDPLYRLVSATGRACKSLPCPPWPDDSVCGYNSGSHGTPDQDGAPNATELYRQQYAYDAAGNMLSLIHQQLVQVAGAAIWTTQSTRSFGMGHMAPSRWEQAADSHLTGDWVNGPGNQLTHFQVRSSNCPPPPTGQNLFYDANGSLIRENTERHFEWDHADRMKVFRNQTGASRPTVYALYLYDASGQRVKKLVWKGSGYSTTTYIDPAFEQHKEVNAGTTQVNDHLHVMDDKQRVALVRAGIAFADDGAKDHPIQYHLGDHLGSSVLVVSGDGRWINREEFFSYGETSFGSFGRKRYRFTGRERDEESGLNYHRARYYAPSYVRWIGPDPIGPASSISLFQVLANNPINFRDPLGTEDLPGGVVFSSENITETPQSSLETDPIAGVRGGPVDSALDSRSGKDSFLEKGGALVTAEDKDSLSKAKPPNSEDPSTPSVRSEPGLALKAKTDLNPVPVAPPPGQKTWDFSGCAHCDPVDVYLWGSWEPKHAPVEGAKKEFKKEFEGICVLGYNSDEGFYFGTIQAGGVGIQDPMGYAAIYAGVEQTTNLKTGTIKSEAIALAEGGPEPLTVGSYKTWQWDGSVFQPVEQGVYLGVRKANEAVGFGFSLSLLYSGSVMAVYGLAITTVGTWKQLQEQATRAMLSPH